MSVVDMNSGAGEGGGTQPGEAGGGADTFCDVLGYIFGMLDRGELR